MNVVDMHAYRYIYLSCDFLALIHLAVSGLNCGTQALPRVLWDVLAVRGFSSYCSRAPECGLQQLQNRASVVPRVIGS